MLQATDIDVTTECAAGHGRVTCWTAYCGPDVNFARDDLAVQPGVVPECVLYVDTYLSGDDDLPAVLEIWSELRPFLESDDYPKVASPVPCIHPCCRLFYLLPEDSNHQYCAFL